VNWNRIGAIASRKFRSIRRDHRMFAFIILMPAIQIILFGFAIGGSPTELDVITVGEHPIFSELEESELLILDNDSDLEIAKQKVENGEAWAVIESNGTTLTVHFDASNQQIMQTIINEIKIATQEIYPTLSLQIAEPIHGEENSEFIDFLAPGIMVLVCFMFSLILTTMAFVGERNDGTLDRLFAAGVQPSEVLLGHLLAFSVIIIGQVSVVISIAVIVFEVPMHGSIILLFSLGLLLGWAAMCLGLFLSIKAKSEFQAMQLVMPIVFPVLLLSGILWPVEALPLGLKEFSMLLPTTWAAESFRSIMMRGWGLSNPLIWKSFLIIFAFGAVTLFAAAKSIKVRS
jgi:ABC-2 type transport system permease protein